MRRKRLVTLVGSTCLILTLAALPFMGACAPTPAPPPPEEKPTPSEAPPAEEEAEILHLGATTAFQSRIGIQLRDILYMNADLLNKAGGLKVGGKTYKIKYHIYDDKYRAEAGRAAIEKLVYEDGIKFNVGTFSSAVTLAMLEVTEPNKIPIFGGAATEKAMDPKVKYFMHCYPGTGVFADVKMSLELRPDIKSVLICTYDDETGRAVGSRYMKAFQFYGIKTFEPLYFRHGETDFSSIATKALELNPDCCRTVAVVVGAEYVQFIKALREAGYEGAIEGEYITQSVLDDIVGKVGKEAVEGIMTWIVDPTHPGLPVISPEAAEFRKNYEEYYGKWETDGLQWAGCWYTWLAAVKRANSLDPDKVMAAVDADFTVSTPLGAVKLFRRPDLGNDRFCEYAIVIRKGIVKDGKVTLLCEKDADYHIDCFEEVYGVSVR